MKKLTTLRKNRGLSIKDLSRAMGVAECTIALYENGKRHPNYSMLLKLADYFGVTTDYLLRDDAEEKLPDDLMILIANIKKLSAEKKKKLLDIAYVMFKEDFEKP